MILLRRALTIPLGLLLLVVLLLALVLLQASDTILSPDYYPRLLGEANFYEFALVDLATSALDEARELPPSSFHEDLEENPLVTSGLSTVDIVSALNRAISPEWVQGQVEIAVEEVGEYITGARDDFAVTVQSGDQVVTTVSEIKGLLQKADVYNLLFEEAVTPAIEDAVRDGLPFGLDITSERLTGAVRATMPPDWLQAQVEAILDEVTPYMVGEEETFEITLPLQERVESARNEIMALLRETDSYGLLFDEVVTPAIEDALAERLPLGLHITAEELVQSVRTVAPRHWVEAQVESALDAVTPYLTGETNTFTFKVPLEDRAEVAAQEIKSLLRKAEAYELLYEEVVEPAVLDGLGESVSLPFGIEVTVDEVIVALRRVAPTEWVQEQAETVIDEAVPYISGRTDSLAVHVSLADNKRQAREIIVETVVTKIAQAVDELPVCSAGEAAGQLIAVASLSLPRCVPEGVNQEEIVERFAGLVADGVDSFVLGAIPDRIKFTDSVLRRRLTEAGAADNVELLDDIREIVSQGWVYTETDLREHLREGFSDGEREFDVLKTLDDVRELLAEGWVYTDQDLREDLLNEGAEEAVEALADVRSFLSDGWTYTEADMREDITQAGSASDLDRLDRARNAFSLGSRLRLLIYLPLLALLAGIGFLGGRGWSGRLLWAGAFLAGASVFVFVAAGPVYDAFAEPRLDDLREEAHDAIDPGDELELTQRLAVDKVFDMAKPVVDGFVGGVGTKSLVLIVVGIGGVAGAVTIGRRRQRLKEPPTA